MRGRARAAIEELRARVDALEAALHEAGLATEILATTSWVAAEQLATSPLVSVVTPTRDRAGFLAGCIDSVLGQSYPHLEHVIVDDASTDATADLLAAVDDPRLRVVRLDEHVGAAAARNAGLDAATGELVVHLDSDNRFDPGWLHAVVWAFEQGLASHHLYGARLFDDFARANDPATRGLPALQLLTWDDDAIRLDNRVDMNVLAHRATAHRFDPEAVIFDDWDFLRRLVGDHGPPLRLPVLAVRYRTDAPDRMMAVEAAIAAERRAIVRRRWRS